MHVASICAVRLATVVGGLQMSDDGPASGFVLVYCCGCTYCGNHELTWEQPLIADFIILNTRVRRVQVDGAQTE